VGVTSAEGAGATAPTGRGGQRRRDDPVVTDGREDTVTLLDAVLVGPFGHPVGGTVHGVGQLDEPGPDLVGWAGSAPHENPRTDR